VVASSIDRCAGRIQRRRGSFESEAFPKSFAILDRRKLLDALRSFDLTIADNVIPFEQVITALEAKLSD